jgi:L-iditol 2-dehydrogenase
MKSAYLIELSRIEIIEKPIPSIKEDEVLVKVKSALTCGTDLKAYLRGHSLIPMPGPFGHEFSGVIEEVGGSVKGFKKGDAVMLVHTAPCENCVYCKKGLFNLCETLTKDMMLGAFSEYIVVKNRVVKQNMFHKPDNVDFAEAAFLEPLSCVLHGIKAVCPSEDDKILVIGTGPIGLLFLQVLKSIGITVAVMGRNKNKLALAKSLGADMIYGSDEDPKKFTDGFGYDKVVECTGQRNIWHKSIYLVRKGGTVLLFGGLKANTEVCFDAGRLHYDEITLKGAFHYNPYDVRESVKLIQSKKLKLKELITDKIPLSKISLAFEKLSRGEGIKYQIEP